MKFFRNNSFKFSIIFLLVIAIFKLAKPGPCAVKKVNKSPSSSALYETQEVQTDGQDLKMEYFDDAIGEWGSVKPDGETEWKAIDSKYAERSAPTPIVYSAGDKFEPIKLRPVSRDEIDMEFYDDSNMAQIDNIYDEYGDRIGGYFVNQGEDVVNYYKFDVDGDGLEEEIVETMGIGGNHPPHNGYIIKGEYIISIFSGNINSVPDGNGYFIKSLLYDQDDEDRPMCCATGYNLTRVVFENGEFNSVWEQDVRYIEF